MMIDPKSIRQIADAYTQAWNAGSADAVAAFHATDGRITINRGTPGAGRAGVAAMAAGFFADVPDLTLSCDDLRMSGDHVAYIWTFSGHHAGSGRTLRISGWEEWDPDAEGKVPASLGWFDAADYARQATGS